MQVNLKLELFKLFCFEFSIVSSKATAKIKRVSKSDTDKPK